MSLPTAASFDTYGGEKADYDGGVEDPTTDRSAEEVNAAFADLAAMTRTSVRAWVTFAALASPSITDHDAVWGNGNDVSPTVTTLATGHYELTWPETITDELGAEVDVNLTVGWANVGGAFAAGTDVVARAYRTGPNIFRVSVSGMAHGAPATTGPTHTSEVTVFVL